MAVASGVEHVTASATTFIVQLRNLEDRGQARLLPIG
jgi:hypothetical protein